jgi:hypothetical protein
MSSDNKRIVKANDIQGRHTPNWTYMPVSGGPHRVGPTSPLTKRDHIHRVSSHFPLYGRGCKENLWCSRFSRVFPLVLAPGIGIDRGKGE